MLVSSMQQNESVIHIDVSTHFRFFYEKMFSITNYQRNASQNYNEVSLHTSQNGHHQKKKATNNKFWRGYGEKGNFLHYWECTLGGNVNWCSHYGRQYGGFFKTKTRAATHS